MACEERRSSASKIDTHGKFESRSLQAMPVNEVANENEPTPPVLPKLSRLNGQTGHLQAEQAEQAEEFEKKSEFEYLTDNLSHEMKAVQNLCPRLGRLHEKKIEAMHIDNIFSGVPARRTTCPSSPQSKRDAILVRHPCTSSASSSTPGAVSATYTTTIITSATLAAATAALSRHSRHLGRHCQTGHLLSEL